MAFSKPIAVIGSGSWGTTLANVLADAGNEVVLWGRDDFLLTSIQERHENPKYLPGIKLSKKIKTAGDLKSTLAGSRIIVCSIPTQQIRHVFAPFAAQLKSKTIVNTSKGIEEGSYARVSEIFQTISGSSTYVVLSGPSFALEVAQRLPAAVTAASISREAAAEIQRSFSTAYFRVYTSSDVAGVELAGALKNIVAIAAGIVMGLSLGYNAQAALINRGVAEMTRLGKTQGAHLLTFLGLAGMGDLILTCTGPQSRNRRLGVGLGEGKGPALIQKELGGVAEGYFTARAAYELAKKLGVEMPVTEQVHRILYENRSPQAALKELMGRELKEEWV